MADGPGGKSVGRVSVRVVPDTSRFGKELRAQLKKIEDQIKATIGVDLDDEGLKKKVQAAAKNASGEKVKFEAELDSDHLTRETKNAKQVAQKATGKISLTAGLNIKASLAKIWIDLKAINAVAKAYRIRIPVDWVGLSTGLLIAGALSASLLSVSHIVGAIGGAVNVLGGALALIPALTAGAAAGLSAVIVGMEGMGAALSASGDPEKFAEALKNLAPSAQEAAKALASFKEPLHEIRMSVQQSLFDGMSDDILKLKSLLPPIKGGLTGIAGSIRDMGTAWIEMATSQESIRDTGIILGLTQSAFQNARPALANFGQALKDITVVGASFLPKMGLSVNRISDRFATWAANARETGRMEQWIQNSWEKLKQFGRVLSDIVAIFREFSEAMRGGRDFLDIIEGWTQALRRLLESAEGQSTLANLGTIMREVARVAGTVFKEAFSSISEVLQAATPFLLEFARSLGGAIVGALQILTPMLKSLFQFLSDNKEVMAPLAVGITGVVTAFKLFSTVGAGLKTIWGGLKGIWSAANLVWDGLVLMKKGFSFLWGIAGNIATWSKIVIGHWVKVAAAAVANAAKSAAAWIGQMARTAAITIELIIRQTAAMIANWVKIAAAALLRAGLIAAAWISQMTLMVTTTISRLATMAGIWVVNWVRMAAVALAQAARMALAWLIAMGPIALVIAAIVALVALIILNWDRIVEVTKAIFTGIWDFIVFIFNTVKDAIITAWNAVIDFFRNLPGWIGDALSTVGEVLSWPFRKAWDWVTDKWDGIGDWFSKVGGWIETALGNVWDVLTWPFRKAWEKIEDILGWIKDAIDWIGDRISDVVDWIGGLFSDQLDIAISAGMSVPVAFTDLPEGSLPSIGFEPYAGEGLMAGTGSLDSLAASVGRASRDLTNSSTDLPTKTSDQDPIAEAVERALDGWSVVIDPRGMARLTRKGETLNARRR